ncbi:type III pantothenate kinase [Clostridiales bacterium]|nr:type III pantothenate kinase [Clostridiales bacterium]
MAFDVHGFDKDSIDGAIISSVVPSVTFSVKRAVEKYLNVKAKLVGPGIKTGLSIEIDDPAQLGSDLVAEAV